MTLEYPDPELRDDVVALRRWEMADLGCVEAASLDPAIPAFTTVPAPYGEREGRAYIERQWSRRVNDEGISLAIADAATGEAHGCIVLFHRVGPQAGAVGLGYWVSPGARGRGLASHAVRVLAEWALRVAGIPRVEALVEPANAASRRVVERAGFQREGYLRSYLSFEDRRADALVYSLLRGDLG